MKDVGAAFTVVKVQEHGENSSPVIKTPISFPTQWPPPCLPLYPNHFHRNSGMFTRRHSLPSVDGSGSAHLTWAGPTTTFPKSVGSQGDEGSTVPSLLDEAVRYKLRSHQLTFCAMWRTPVHKRKEWKLRKSEMRGRSWISIASLSLFSAVTS